MSGTSLELLFEKLRKPDYSGIPNSIKSARENFKLLKDSYRNKTGNPHFEPDFIENVLYHCENGRFEQAKHFVWDAKEEHEKMLQIVTVKIASDNPKDTSDQHAPSTERAVQTTREDQLPDEIDPASVLLEDERRLNAKERVEDNQTYVRNASLPCVVKVSDGESEDGRVKTMNESADVHSQSLGTEIWDRTKVRERLRKLYDDTWSIANEHLQDCGLNERELSKLLLDILKSAFSFTRAESERHITEMTHAVHSVMRIVQRGNIHDREQDDQFLLRMFLINHAALSVQRLQEVFVKDKLPDVLSRLYSRVKLASDYVQLYASEAAEVTWWMNLQTPPMVISSDKDVSKYEPVFKRKSQIIDYIVWPALLDSDHGQLLDKGYALFM